MFSLLQYRMPKVLPTVAPSRKATRPEKVFAQLRTLPRDDARGRDEKPTKHKIMPWSGVTGKKERIAALVRAKVEHLFGPDTESKPSANKARAGPDLTDSGAPTSSSSPLERTARLEGEKLPPPPPPPLAKAKILDHRVKKLGDDKWQPLFPPLKRTVPLSVPLTRIIVPQLTPTLPPSSAEGVKLYRRRETVRLPNGKKYWRTYFTPNPPNRPRKDPPT